MPKKKTQFFHGPPTGRIPGKTAIARRHPECPQQDWNVPYRSRWNNYHLHHQLLINEESQRDCESGCLEEELKIKFEDVKAKFGDKASEYANDKKKAQNLVDKAMKKAGREKGKKGPLDKIWEKIQLLFGMVKDWAKGDYKEVPKGSIVVILIGLLYFMNPIDVIPDFLIGVGFIDDVFVLGLVMKQVSSDIDKYKEWLKAKNETEN
jgi:uncharacterized membrane protein YkvA (DUF1232 family)